MKIRTIILTALLFAMIAKVSAQRIDTVMKAVEVPDTISAVEKHPDKNNDPIFTIVKIEPGFPGGEEALFSFLVTNIRYPQIAKEKNITGLVIVTFVVEKDGSLTNIQVLKNIGGGCGDEAVRIIKMMPDWIPGKQNELPVRVQFNLPVRFKLQ